MTTNELKRKVEAVRVVGNFEEDFSVGDEDVEEVYDFGERVGRRRGSRCRRRSLYDEKSCLLEWLALKEGTLNKMK